VAFGSAFDKLCPANDKCTQTAVEQRDRGGDVGLSALAALAFLGAGHTHQRGPYAVTLTKTLEYILARQKSNGDFAADSGFQIYDDAVATLAIAEAYAMTRDPILADPLRRAVAFLESAQQAEGGWDYTANNKTGRDDTSITGWVMMAFKSAQAAGAPASIDARFRLLAHFDRATESDGRVWYADKPPEFITDPVTGESRPRFGSSMTAVGLYARCVLGLRTDAALAVKQADLLAADPPSLPAMYHDKSQLQSEYYWYYGTLAMFNVGGPRWQTWNQALRRSVLEYQERPTRKDGSHKHAYGSWPAFGPGWGQWGRTGSRVYSTAINVLTLEVYYRYEPAYLSRHSLIGPAEVRRRLATLSEAEQPRLLQLTLRLQPDIAEPVLLEFLRSKNARVQLDAAVELGRLGSPRAEAALRDQRMTASDADRARVDAALETIAATPRRFDCGPVREVDAASGMFLFDTAGRPIYYGQVVTLLRDGKPIGRAVVNRRFSAERAAAARLDDRAVQVRIGDQVTTREDDHAADKR